MNTKPLLFLIFSIIFCAFFSVNTANASHNMGMELSYTHISGTTYRIEFTRYADCNSVLAPTTINIQISSACTATTTMSLASVYSKVISNNCPTLTNACMGGSSPGGANKQFYTGVYTFPSTPCNYTLSFTECCMPSTITTLSSPSASNAYTEITLNTAVQNSSPHFVATPAFYVFKAQNTLLNCKAFDNENDSLVYSLVPTKINATTNIAYNLGFSGTVPFTATVPTQLNAQTGIMSITPTSNQMAVYAVLVKEYRNGQLIGTVRREVLLIIGTGTNTANAITITNPTITGGGTYNAQTKTFTVTNANATIEFDVIGTTAAVISAAIDDPFSSTNPNATVTGTANQKHLSFTAGNANRMLRILGKDDVCPFSNREEQGFYIVYQSCNLQATATVLNSVSCNGGNNGKALASVTGGNSPYSYAWDMGIGNPNILLNAGIHTVTVTDANNCTATASVMIIEPSWLSIAVFATQYVTCMGGNDGAAATSVSGGTLPYTYFWDNNTVNDTVNNLNTGIHGVTVTDANGCSVSASVQINGNTSTCVFPGDTNNDGVADNDDLLPIALQNNATGYTRASASSAWTAQPCSNWSTIIPNTTTNTKHADCNGNGTVEATDTLAILQNYGQVHPPRPAPQIANNLDPVLQIVLPPASAQPLSFPYLLAADVVLGSSTQPAQDFYGLAFTINYDASLVSSASIAAENSSWLATNPLHLQHNNQQGQLDAAIARSMPGNANGFGKIATCYFLINSPTTANPTFNISVSDIHGIDNQNITKNVQISSSSIILNNTVGVSENNGNQYIHIFPNPTKDNLTISLENKDEMYNLQLVNAFGQIILTKNIAETNTVLNTENLAAGSYFIYILGKNGKIVKKFVKI